MILQMMMPSIPSQRMMTETYMDSIAILNKNKFIVLNQSSVEPFFASLA